MDNLSRSNSKASQPHSSAPSKQKRSGYEPSDTEVEWHESPWNDHNNQDSGTSDLGEAGKIKSNMPRNISSVKLSRRQSSKFEYDKGSPPRRIPLPRRHANKSPYKTRRDDGRNISPLPKSEHRRHVSPYKPGRLEHALNDVKGNGEITGLIRKQIRGSPTGDEIKTIGQLVGAERGNEDLKYSHRSTSAPPRQRGERTPSPIIKNIIRKKREAPPVKQPSVGEINEMVANAKISKSPIYTAPMYESTESISPGDIFFSRDTAALPNQKKDNPPRQRPIANRNVNPKARGSSSSTGFSRTAMTASSATSRQSSGKLSVENSKISDSSGSSLNSVKFASKMKKSQSETWFACVMRRGSCRTSKKSPEREKAFDEASFIGKAFIVEKLRQFWADQYQPTSLNGFTCHKQEAQILKQLVSHQSCPHILFKGPSGSGKRALTMAFLREIYGDPSWNVRFFPTKTIPDSFTYSKEKRAMQVIVPIASSAFHVELNVTKETNAKYALMGLVKEISTNYIATPEVSNDNFKTNYKGLVFFFGLILISVLVLYDVDKAPDNIRHLIKWIMDCHSDSCKFILCCEDDVNIVESVTSHCRVIKVDAPVTHEIMELLIQIARKEDFELSMNFAAKIAAKSKQNLRKAIMALEACKAHKYPFADDQPIPLEWEEVVTELATEILADPSHKRLPSVRAKLQKLVGDFVHPKLILQKLVEEFLKKVEAGLKRELYYWHAYYEKRLPAGTSALLKLEEFVAKFIGIHRKSSANGQCV
ncbi:Isoflavone reductase-like protein 4 isoform 1 [Hibiscus syriacus]|uniref:Isoflavone reductase-like protein 4 isoform 1 n=1 Tax=Hibiscus syriacus TaxID=106335 RepID=A0A6A3AXH9_HIBSY|nr:Isoflavone reductase-like protein 4 isoform 1 [Hibiscus syriacus]